MNIGGKKINNWWLVGGAAGLGLVLWLNRRGGLGSSPSNSSATDPLTGLPYSSDNQVDPATGMTYLQEAQQYGSVAAAEQAAAGGVPVSVGGGTGAVDSGFPTISGISGQAPTGSSFSSNAQWAQAVTAGLTDLGYSPTDVAAALGLYFQSQPLGSGADGVSYLSIVQAAVAEFGPPPVGSFPIVGAHSSGNPPPPVPPATPGGPASPPQPPGAPPPRITVPDLTGERVQNATSALASLGLRASFGRRRPGVAYLVTATSPKQGAHVARGSVIHLSIQPMGSFHAA